MTLEPLLYGITASVALVVVSAGLRRAGLRAWPFALALGLFALLAGLAFRPASQPLAAAVPQPRDADAGFVSSDTCRACHPAEYDAWQRSYHRTMTQAATPVAVLGDFGGVTVSDRGRTYRLEREGDAFYIVFVDPRWDAAHASPTAAELAEAPRLRERVVMTTGSHHLQAYWIRHPDGNGNYHQLPVMWDIRGKRWLPTQDSFLQPPDHELATGAEWNTACIDCHSVAGVPGEPAASGSAPRDTRVVELGIACEACHGPAHEHARANRSPLARYAAHFSNAPDATVVQPERLDHRRSSELCGQCHSSAGTVDLAAWTAHGQAYRAGGELAQSRDVLRWSEQQTNPRVRAWLEQEPDGLVGRFWRDGTIRVAGRELNGLVESPCYQRGEMSCLSCHSMHGYQDRSDQLAPGMEGDQACLQCHAEYSERVAEHTHHRPGTAGSACYDCHMPHTTYGLFGAMRAHRVDSPSVSVTLASGRPNACNLCHADRTLAWTADYLLQWYGEERPDLSQEPPVAAAVLWLLRGDAAQRAIVAWNVGQEASQLASGPLTLAPFLANALDDEYAAVRYVAFEALKRFPGHADLRYDYLAPSEQRMAVARQVIERWERLHGSSERRPELLRSPAGEPLVEAIDALLRQRDRTPITIIE